MADPKFDEMAFYKKDEVVKVDYTPPAEPWAETKIDFKQKYGNWIYAAKPKALERVNFPNPREWSPDEDDWKLKFVSNPDQLAASGTYKNVREL